MPKIQKTPVDDVVLSPDKHILSGFTLHTGEFETERYFEELDLESEAVCKKQKKLSPTISMVRLLNSVKEPESKKEEADEKQPANDKG